MHMALCPYDEAEFRSPEHGSSASAWFGVGPAQGNRYSPRWQKRHLAGAAIRPPRPNQTRKATRLLLLRSVRMCRTC